MKNQPTLKGSFRTKGETLIAKACRTVPGFDQTYNEFERHLTLQQRSKSAMMNYGRSLAKVALHFSIDPLNLSMEQINDYLYSMLKTGSPSKSYFRHTVYGLKNLYRMKGKEVKALQMPPVRDNNTLPVVMSCTEIKRMLATTKNLKHRVLIALLYASGLRMNEARMLKLTDIDSHRMQIRVRQGKGRKDRYVVLSALLLRGLRTYYMECKPSVYLFNGNTPGDPMGTRSIQYVINEAIERAGIQKPVSCHTLRHSFATHMLEQGVDLFSIKEQLGHARIDTTLVYLHVAHFSPKTVRSPLDVIYQQ